MSARAARERRLAAGLGAALALLLGAIALVVRHDARGTRDDAPLARAMPSRVSIERPGRDALVLAREGDDWRVISPCPIDAEDARVAPLVEALSASAPGYPAEEVDLEAAGLVEPLATVRLDEEPVRLGGTDLGGERRYALRGRRVSFVPEWTLSLVDGGLSAIAVPSPLDGAPRAVRRLASGDDGGARSPDASPEGSPAAEPGLAAATEGGDGTPAATTAPATGGATALDPAPWAALAARQVVTWPVPDAPPATRRARLEVTLASGGTRRLDIEGNASWTAVRVDGGGCAFLFGADELPGDVYRPAP